MHFLPAEVLLTHEPILCLCSFVSGSQPSLIKEFEEGRGPSKRAKLICRETFDSMISGKKGLLVVPTTKCLQFTTSRCTDTEIFAARHVNNLEPSKDRIYVRLDSAQRGLGTGSCGPQTLPEYQVNGGVHEISFWVKPNGF